MDATCASVVCDALLLDPLVALHIAGHVPPCVENASVRLVTSFVADLLVVRVGLLWCMLLRKPSRTPAVGWIEFSFRAF